MTNDWNKSHRKERFNPCLERTRREVLDYYGWRCQYPVIGDDGVLRPCGAHANEVDHIIRAEDGQPDDDSWDNLQVLCRAHHSYKTGLESADARRRKRVEREEARWYRHPAFG